MTTLDATHEAHRRWKHLGQGIAVSYREPLLTHHTLGHMTFGPMQYLVGIAKDKDSIEVFGRSPVGFEDAFDKAEGR